MPEPNAALAQTPPGPAASPTALRFANITLEDPLAQALAIVSTPETRGGPFGRVTCGKCNTEFLTSRPNLKCPKCEGTPTGASLERAFGRGDEKAAEAKK